MVYVLDLGTSKVACLAAKADADGNVHFMGFAEEPCKGLSRGVVTDLDAAAEAVQLAVRRVRTMADEEPGPLTVNINGSHLDGTNAQGFVPIYPKSRPITREDVLHVINHSRQLLPSPDREQIQALPREFRLDGQKGIQKPVGMNGGRLEVVTHIVTAQTTHIQNIDKAVGMAGFKVKELIASPLASAAGVATDQELDLGCAVIDIGAGTTSVAVFVGGAIAFTSVIPVGSAAISSDLSKLLKTTPDEAESLKLRFGGALAAMAAPEETVEVLQLGQTQSRHLARKVLCEIIESRVREVAMLVRQQIEKSGLIASLPSGLILTGGGSQLPGITRLFESVIKHMNVRTAQPEAPGQFEKQLADPRLAVAVGLAKNSLEMDEEDISPASGMEHLRVKIRTLKALFSSKI